MTMMSFLVLCGGLAGVFISLLSGCLVTDARLDMSFFLLIFAYWN